MSNKNDYNVQSNCSSQLIASFQSFYAMGETTSYKLSKKRSAKNQAFSLSNLKKLLKH